MDRPPHQSIRVPITGRYAAYAGLAVFALGIALYARTVHYAFLNWDDPSYVVNNPWIRTLSFENLRAIFTRPVQGGILPVHLLSYALDYGLWGLDPYGYHLHSVLLNAANGVLAFCVIAQLTARREVALVSAVLFTVHPSHVEAVAWVSARKDLTATAFLLLAIGAYLRARRDAVWHWPSYVASIALFGLGLLAKVTISVYPLFLLLVDAVLDARLPPERRHRAAFHLATKLPFLALAAVWVSVNAHTQILDPGRDTPLVYALVKGLAAWRYGWLLTGVKHGQPLYDLPPVSLQPAMIALSLAPLAVPPLLVLWAVVRRHPEFALALGWLVAGLIPPIAFPVISFIADRYLYAPSLGFCWLLALGIAWLAGLLKLPAARHAALVVLCVPPVLWFAPRAWHYTPVWRDSLSMWSYAAQYSRYKLAAIGLVTTLREEGRLDEALRVTDTALDEAQGSLATAQLRSELHAARAEVLWKLERRAEAIAEWERAVGSDPANSAARDKLSRARMGKL